MNIKIHLPRLFNVIKPGFLFIFIILMGSWAVSEVLFSPEGRIVIREGSGRVTVYTDKDGDGTFDVVEVLAPGGVSQVIMPSAGRILLRGSDLTVYVDSDKDGHYEVKHTLIPTDVSSVQLTGQGRVVVKEKSGRVTVFTDTDGNGTYDSIHNLAVGGVSDVTVTAKGRVLLRYPDGRLVVFCDKDNDSTYEIIETLAAAGVDWYTVSAAGYIFFRVKGVITVLADIDDDGIYEQKYIFPETSITSVTITGDNRVILRNSQGGLTEYFDKNKNCTYSVYQQLMISGTKNFSIPTNGKLIVEGNDGSVAVYWDRDNDGIYETTSIFGVPSVTK